MNLPGPDDGVAGLDVIQTALLKKIDSLEIKPHEFLTDAISRSPYKLMPDYNNSDETDGEGNTIEIYYKNNQLIEPIEKRSHIVFTLARNRPFMIRGFVVPEKYEVVRQYLDSTFDYVLPSR